MALQLLREHEFPHASTSPLSTCAEDAMEKQIQARVAQGSAGNQKGISKHGQTSVLAAQLIHTDTRAIACERLSVGDGCLRMAPHFYHINIVDKIDALPEGLP